jgi:hypothetical protein
VIGLLARLVPPQNLMRNARSTDAPREMCGRRQQTEMWEAHWVPPMRNRLGNASDAQYLDGNAV